MTESSRFKNPAIANLALSEAELENILKIQGQMLKQAIVRDDYDQLIDELCLLAESFTPNAVATVMLLDESRQTMFVNNGPSLTPAAKAAFDGLRCGDGSCGNAVFHHEAMYVCNTQEDPRWEALRDVAKEFQIASCFSVPIFNADACIGSFAISSFEGCEPHGFHKTLLETCANICGVILQRRSDETLRQRILADQARTQRIESLGILAGGIAHDFNNLLTAILGNIDLSAALMPAGPAQETLDLAMKAVDRAKGLTGQMLSLARGGQPVRSANNIEQTIRESAQFVLHGSNVDLKFSGIPDSGTPPVMDVDGGQISQLVQNLVLNARQAMPDGGTIRISCEAVDHSSAPLSVKIFKLRVADSGPGIPEEIREQIYDPFFTTRNGGHGMGLFLCYSIARKHGGQIRLEETAAGTTFVVELPWVVPENVGELSTTETEPESPSADSQVTPAATILIMDDDDLVRQTLRLILEQLGYSVLETKHGDEALAAVSTARSGGRQIDAFVLDLTIAGGMGGLETQQHLRRKISDAKIIVSSGYSDGNESIDAAQCGFDGSISKPYRIADVRRMLSSVLAGNSKS